MEGKAKVAVAEYQAQQPATRDLYKHLQKDGKWIERKDVWIKYLKEKGNLTVGYGSPKCIGPELEFGLLVGDHYNEQVLLIKTAWGGRSLYRDFRSPSPAPARQGAGEDARRPEEKNPNATLEDVKKPFGAPYRAMFSEINGTLANLKTHFPDYAGQGHEIAGFIWFQGWNDMINANATADYTLNMQHFIRDVRKEFKAPKLPFVIGQVGVDGLKATQRPEVQGRPVRGYQRTEFKGNVAVVKTDVFWDTDAEAIFKKGWRENLDGVEQAGQRFPFPLSRQPEDDVAASGGRSGRRCWSCAGRRDRSRRCGLKRRRDLRGKRGGTNGLVCGPFPVHLFWSRTRDLLAIGRLVGAGKAVRHRPSGFGSLCGASSE